jgi:hypothetical protein
MLEDTTFPTVRRWREAGGKLRFEALDLQWGPLQTSATGEGELDALRRLEGRLVIPVARPAPVLSAIANGENVSNNARSALQLLAAGVIERTREIGAIRVVGVRRRSIRRMVLMEGLVLGVIGLALAAASGLALGTLWVDATFPALLGWVLQPHVPYAQAGVVMLLTMAVCVLAALGPARRAASLEPAVALRYE